MWYAILLTQYCDILDVWDANAVITRRRVFKQDSHRRSSDPRNGWRGRHWWMLHHLSQHRSSRESRAFCWDVRSDLQSRKCSRTSSRRGFHRAAILAVVVSLDQPYRSKNLRTNVMINSFYINLPFGVFAIGGVAGFYSAPSGARWSGAAAKDIFLQMDPLGLVTIIGALVCYMLALQWGGQQKAWNSPSVIGCFVAWILLMIVFIVIQAFQKDSYSSVNRRILSNKTILACVIYIFL